MKNETLAHEYWRVSFKQDIKFKDARIRVLTERMIKIFLETNPPAPPRDTETSLLSEWYKKTNKF